MGSVVENSLHSDAEEMQEQGYMEGYVALGAG
jgi:hypothetical protein